MDIGMPIFDHGVIIGAPDPTSALRPLLALVSRLHVSMPPDRECWIGTHFFVRKHFIAGRSVA